MSDFDPIGILTIVVIAILAVSAIWWAFPFANRSSLLKKLAAQFSQEFDKVESGEEDLTSELHGNKLGISITEHISSSWSSSGGSSRRRTQDIETRLTLSDFPSGLSLSLDTLFSTMSGAKELSFDDPDFDNAFWVEATDEDAARKYLNPQRREIFAKSWVVESSR